MSFDLKKSCNDIGMLLHALEEGTPWSNKAELYIILHKEAVHKDMWEEDSPLIFWDNINNLSAKSNLKLHSIMAHIEFQICGNTSGMNGVVTMNRLQNS